MRQAGEEGSDLSQWRISERDLRQWIEIGGLRVPRDDVVACRLEDVVERDFAGRVATLGLLVAAILVLLLGLVDLGWRPRVMLGSLALGIIAIVSCMEALGLSSTVHYHLELLLRDGRCMTHTTTSRSEAEDLAAALGSRWSEHFELSSAWSVNRA